MSKSETSQIRGEALRHQVLDTALKLFSEKGYFKTSIHDIRKEAGVSIGAIYHHFENKEALAKALYDLLVLRMEAAIDQACTDLTGTLDRSRAIIKTLFEMTETDPQTMQFILLAQHREYLPDEPPICSSRPFQFMKEVVEEGIAKGEVMEIEPWVAATAMYGGALRMMGLKMDGALEPALDQYLDETVACGWRAIKT